MTINFPRRRTIVLLSVGVALLAASALALLRPGGGAAEATGLSTQSATVGAVDVTMTALVLDTSGAQFRLALNTHSGSLDIDVARAAQLWVAGRPIEAGTWEGAGPGGHHREGTLRFATPVPAGARVELRLTGLPGEALGTWTAP